MQRDSSKAVIRGGVVELFSDMMLMKFKPKNTEGMRLAKDMHPVRRRLLSEDKIGLSENQQASHVGERLSHIQFLEVASKEAVILGNVNQLDMIGLDGLTHNFVDTYHYWSLNISRPILDLKVNPKKQLFLLLCPKALLLFSYNSLRRDRVEPEQLVSIDIRGDVRFMQFPTSDIIALFYESHFELYSLNDANQVTKKAEKKYGVAEGFKLLAVPLAIDQSVNLFFEQKQTGRKTFGLWCLEVQLGGEHARVQTIYKIYDIMNGLKKQLILENYSKDIVFLNLGQEILVAKKGYILDSVNINLQVEHSFLKYLPAKQILVHIERSVMQIYSFQIDVSSLPHRIHLKYLDSIEIRSGRNRGKLMSLLPMFDRNYALFYEDESSKLTTKGQIFYSFALSYTVGVTEKVGKVLDIGIPMGELTEDQIEAKCDILRKMGLNDRQIYLEIWRKSGRSSLRDYQFILSTQDYKTIKTQIENKLRKQSMSFKEVYKIEESCLIMLRSQLANERCNEDIIKDFLTCSLLLRRLSLYRQLQQIQPRNTTEEHHFFINIQDYYTFKNTELKQFLMEKLSLLELGKPNALNQVRLVLSHFRFVYRYIYHDLLEEIVKLLKQNLRSILASLPELLPMEEGGFWGPITESEWEEGLYLSKIINVSNKQIIEQFVQGIWFKRNWLTSHDLIARSVSDIEIRSARNNSVETFYFFLEKTFENLKDEQTIKDLLAHLQETYSRFPSHLRKRQMLYWRLWKYYCENYEAAKCPKLSLRQFLRLQDHQLFIYFFIFEKGRKNSLLREVKPIYEAEPDGGNIFNQSLLNYFSNQSSEVSHLKYLLNRINNEKKEFHALHEGMYEVLVRAMQNKLRIGGHNDVPVDEVLIYVQNIPIAPNNKTMIAELETIQKISDESETFRKMKINMNLRQIIENYEIVIEKLVDYHFKKNNILAVESKSTLLAKTYRILAQIQSLKDKIYGSDYNELALFIYLTRLLEHENKIHFAQTILSDEYLNNFYFIDLKIIESLVQYMYHWKFSQDSSFPMNSSYIRTLVELLPQDNYLRVYIENQLEFAILLSTIREPVRYPFCPKGQYPRINDVEELIKDIDNENILAISISSVVHCMQRLREASIKKAKQESQIIQSDQIEPHSVYQVFIGAYLSRNLIVQVIPLIRECLGLVSEPNPIPPLVMIYRLLPELNEQSRNSLTKIASYLFKNSFQLLQIVEKLLHSKFTGLQASEFLRNQLIQVKAKYSNFEEDNEVFTVYFRHLGEEIKGQSRKALVERCLLRLKKVKVEFSYEYLLDFIFLILCQSPSSLAIFLKNIQYTKWKIIRHFLSYLIQQDIFDELQVLELVRRSFILLLRSHHDGQPIRQVVKQLGAVSLREQFNVPIYPEPTDIEKKMLKNISIFEHKKAKICSLERSFKHSHRKHVFSNKEASLKQHILHPHDNKDKNTEYVFSDSDDDYRPDEPESPLIAAAKKKRKQSKIKFDPTLQRKDFIKRDNIRNVEARRKSPNKISQQGEKRHESQEDEFNHEMKKNNNSKIKKYFSMDVRSGYDEQEGPPVFDESRAHTPKLPFRRESADLTPTPRNQPVVRQNSPPPKLSSPPKRQASKDSNRSNNNILQRRSIESPKSPKSPSQVKAMRSLDELADRLLEEESDQPDLRILKVETKESEEASEKAVEEADQDFEVAALVKKIYKTYSEKLQSQPFNLKALNAEKGKSDNFAGLLKKVINQVWQRPERSADVSIKLIIQIANKYPQLVPINIPYAQIYEKVAKCEAKYGLELPMNKMLPLIALYMKPGPPEDLFDIIKPNIMSVCDQQNLLKISKVISIGFKKNTLEQDIILMYLETSVQKIPQNISEKELSNIFQKIKGLLNKVQVKLLVDKAESIVDHCSHFDARRKLVQLLIDTIRMKGNGKDAKDLAIKLK